MKTTLILAALLAVTPLFAENLIPAEEDETKVIAVRMYADWCGYCKQLDPKVDAIKPDFKGKPVLFLQIDQTDDFAKEQSAMLVGLTGLENALSPYYGRTGILLIVDANTGEVVKKLNHNTTSVEIKELLNNHL